MVIDFHTHVFPEKIVGKAMSVLSRNAGNAEPYIEGTAASLISYMDAHGIDRSVVLNIATNPGQQASVNRFAAEIDGGRLISFGSVHPDAPDALEELRRIKERGLKGIKLHPDYQDFFVDDPRVFPIYETAASLGLITVFHAGVDIGYFEPVHCTPERLRRVLPVFGGGRVVAAHMGGMMLWNEVERHLVGQDIYFDTAYCYTRMPSGHAKRIVKNHGADRILFGSDLPWSGAYGEKRFVESLDLPEKEQAKILGGNAARLLGL